MLAASQYDQDYLPRRLGNWEVPSERVFSSHQMGVRARTGRTQFVVDSRGYLVGAKKPKSAFNLEPSEALTSPARWPEVRHAQRARQSMIDLMSST